MLDPATGQIIRDRVEPFEEVAEAGESTPAAQSLWESWLLIGHQLQELGAAPRSMCDAVNELASIRAEVHETGGTRTA